MLRVVDVSDGDCGTNILAKLPRLKSDKPQLTIILEIPLESLKIRQAITESLVPLTKERRERYSGVMQCFDLSLHLSELILGFLNQTRPRNTISRGINTPVQHEIVRLCSRCHVDTVEVSVLFGILVDERLTLGLRQECPPHGDLLGTPRRVGIVG